MFQFQLLCHLWPAAQFEQHILQNKFYCVKCPFNFKLEMWLLITKTPPPYIISGRNDNWSLLNLQNTYLLSVWHVGDAEL
jgi:hypothetical protein